jgi:2-polyprenyl-6-methoxyphenol hydroxylase-like FAD-dependent oxidoreductase
MAMSDVGVPEGADSMEERTTCVIVGGGPAGMVAGLILARCGVRVTVLEKHSDFLRDFRGDTVHPTTLDLLDELGLYDAFEAVPHTRISDVVIEGRNGQAIRIADLRRLKLKHPFIALAPQWDFLNVLAEAGRREPLFTLLMNAEAVELLREQDRIAGVRYRTDGEDHVLRADLTIAADGRWSLARQDAGPVTDHRVDADVWWFRLPVADGAVPPSILPHAARGNMVVAIPRRGYVQMARLIPKGADQRLRDRGIEVLRQEIAAIAPALRQAAQQVTFADVKLLDVRVDHLQRWYRPGLLCIGDAAHAMSPIGGVGVNLAVADGAAAAARLAPALLSASVDEDDLRAVQRRRWAPMIATQSLQRMLHRMIAPVIEGRADLDMPGPLVRMLDEYPALTAVPARLIAVGLRPEHAPAAAHRSPIPAASV